QQLAHADHYRGRRVVREPALSQVRRRVRQGHRRRRQVRYDEIGGQIQQQEPGGERDEGPTVRRRGRVLRARSVHLSWGHRWSPLGRERRIGLLPEPPPFGKIEITPYWRILAGAERRHALSTLLRQADGVNPRFVVVVRTWLGREEHGP